MKACPKNWPYLEASKSCGAVWADWLKRLKEVYGEFQTAKLLEVDGDGKPRVPAYFQLICIDNLNSINASTHDHEEARADYNKPVARTTYDGLSKTGGLPKSSRS